MKEKFIPANKQNFDRRQRFIILHYTVSDEQDSIETLTRGGVGAHFLVPKQSFKDEEEIYDYYKFVDINDRAWHAGISNFAGRSGLNDTSIGIEIVNYGYGLKLDSGQVLFTYQVEKQLKEYITETLKKDDDDLYQLLENEKLLTAFLADMQRSLVPPADRVAYQEKVKKEFSKLLDKYKQLTKEWRIINDAFVNIAQKDLYSLEQQGKLIWDEYTEHQIDSLVYLIKDIQKKLTIENEKSGEVYYQIPPQFITCHMAIALGRKADPGPRLCIELAKRGIGAWPDEEQRLTIEQEINTENGIDYKWIQNNLKIYGYEVTSTGQLDEQTQNAIRAFQMQFEPECYSGEPSVKTISILEALIKKYYPDKQSDYPRSFKPIDEKKSNNFFKAVRVNVNSANTFNCCVIS
ncbi:MAG: anhydro-N-acetylmuramyl-tripeptide amidase [Pseudomonadota bacterium]|jgi:N-acetyl-anhydromuramyl-L-alanine amidase AmpD